MTEISDYELGHDLVAQKELLVNAYNSGNDDDVENAFNRVAIVRRMKRNGTLEWQNPENFEQ